MLLRERFGDTKFLVFDQETEGLNTFLSKPWELAFLVSRGSEILENHDYYLRWDDLNVSPEAARVTGFDPRIIEEKGRSPKEIFEIFDSYLYNSEYLIVGQNILNYDALIYNSARRRLGLKCDFSWCRRLYDTHLIAKMWKLGLSFNPKDDWLTFQFKLNNYVKKGLKTKLEILLKEFNIFYDSSLLHKAFYDNEMCLKIFQQLIFRVDI